MTSSVQGFEAQISEDANKSLWSPSEGSPSTECPPSSSFLELSPVEFGLRCKARRSGGVDLKLGKALQTLLLYCFFCDFNSNIIPLRVPPHRCKAVGLVDFPHLVLGPVFSR